MLLAFVTSRGGTVFDILLITAVTYLVYRLYQRRRERRLFANATAAAARANGGRWRRAAPSRILDARPDEATPGTQSRIPGALALDPHSPEQIDGALRAYDMVIYCICPDSATAVELTQRMRSNGYTRIRALRGGLDAWQRRGFPVEALAPTDEVTAGKRPPSARGNVSGAITLRGFAPRSSQST